MAQCFDPISVRNKNKDMNHQNLMISVPCGKCINCLKRRATHWGFRINEEAKVSSSACFLTLTYEHPPISENGFHTLQKRDFQTFLKRLRKLVPTKMVVGSNGKKKVNDQKLKYYACGEYGTKTHRPHYHAILFNLPHSIISKPQQIADTWKNGHIHIANNNQSTINYVVGYMQKDNFVRFNSFDDRTPEFSLMSKHMGKAYLTPQMIQYYRKRKLFCITKEGGQILSMPRYYKNIIYSKEELKDLYKTWMEETQFDFRDLYDSEHQRMEHHKTLIRKDNKFKKLKRLTI